MTVPNVTYNRCVKVQKALESDKNTAKLLGPKEHVVHRPPPSNAPVKFSEVVIAVTHAIVENGQDPATMGQWNIFKFAQPILVDFSEGKPLPKFDPVVAPPEPAPAKPKPAPKPKAKAKAVVKAKPLEPLKRRPARPSPVPATNGGPMVPTEEPQPDPEKPDRHVAKQIVFGEKIDGKPVVQRETAPPAPEPLPQPALDDDVRSAPAGSLPYVWGVSANSLVLSALQLIENAGGMRDSQLAKRLNECSNEIVKLTVIPRNAKESSSSPDRRTAA